MAQGRMTSEPIRAMMLGLWLRIRALLLYTHRTKDTSLLQCRNHAISGIIMLEIAKFIFPDWGGGGGGNCRLRHIYGLSFQPAMLELTLSSSQGLWIWQLVDLHWLMYSETRISQDHYDNLLLFDWAPQPPPVNKAALYKSCFRGLNNYKNTKP